ncbi:hypothetical protein HOF56_00970 [Candidatus Peribacteria bacterium]|nr:hypothetical protein [Candidatus Peribacteria bacterium]MBT4020845.1 hypothetical protein [Candidatus Peribacteria bacterium]MBT4241134.1 hypothetical protein [Candidatus Peribacteria bacterium]MBT4473856.1 hypothetical protein [Candidatus Peribacteria bacterium]
MFNLMLVLFAAGLITILLPCILPLIPIVLGTSIAGRSKLRPLFTVIGMLISFVIFTFLLVVVLSKFPAAQDAIRTATYYILLLFGVGFISHSKAIQYSVAAIGSLFFLPKITLVIVFAIIGFIGMKYGAIIASKLQNFGSGVQRSAQSSIGADNPIGALIMGLTLGLVWVPCAGPALSFVFALLRERPGIESIILLTAYGAGTAMPLLLIGYGGQYAVHSVRFLSKFSGKVKQISGVLLIVAALGLQFNVFRNLETWLVQNTSLGTVGTTIEEKWLKDNIKEIKTY